MKNLYIKAVLIISILIISNLCKGQYAEEWRYKDSSWTGEELYLTQILVDSAGNSFVSGSDNGVNGGEFLEKHDASGFRQWRIYVNNGGARQMEFDKLGNITIMGRYQSFNTFIAKYNIKGELLWMNTYDSINIYGGPDKFIIDDSNNIYLGLVHSNSISAYYTIFEKIASNGNLVYKKTFDYNSKFEYPGLNDFQLDTKNDVYFTYSGFNPALQFYVGFLSKLDPNGNLIFNDSIKVDSVKGLYVLLDDSSNVILWEQDGVPRIIKCDSIGNIEWILKSTPGCYYSDAFIDSDNEIYLATSELSYMRLRKVNSAGSIVWNSTYLPVNHTGEYSSELKEAPDGTIFESGARSYTPGGDDDFYMVNISINKDGLILSSNETQVTSKEQLQNNDFGFDKYKNIYQTTTIEPGGMNYGISYKLCSGCMETIKGISYDDSNSNCSYDSSETLLNNRILHFMPEDIYTTTNASGSFSIAIKDTSIFVKQLNPDNWSGTCNNDSVSINISSSKNQDSITIGSNKLSNVNDLQLDYSTSVQAKPGSYQEHVIEYQNIGSNAISSGYVRFYLDTSVFVFNNSTPPPDTITGNVYAWKVLPLIPDNRSEIDIVTSISFNAPIGEIVKDFATIYPISGDNNPKDNSDTVLTVVKRSHDPNLKSVSTTYTNQANPLSPVENELAYQIEFQNTGNDTATLVRINDTLDANLDIATIRFGASSQSYTWQIAGKGILRFTFNNIVLPDSSTNEMASHGFIKYYIKPKAGLNPSTIIANTANIYFDNNAPVKTNTVYYPKNAIATSVKELVALSIINIYPNPTSDILNITSSVPASIAIFNVLGQEIFNSAYGRTKFIINTSNLSNGLYFVRFNVGKEIKQEKFIIQH